MDCTTDCDIRVYETNLELLKDIFEDEKKIDIVEPVLMRNRRIKIVQFGILI